MLLSIVIPCYNAGMYLRECLDSIVLQQFSDFECIIVNDGSTDNTLDICKEYQGKDKRFVVVNKENGGVSSARNAGIQVAVGDYIHFIDADDYVLPDAELKVQKQIAIKGYPDLLFFNFIELRTTKRMVCDLDLLDCLENRQYFQHIPHLPYFYREKNGVTYRYGGFFPSVWRIWIKREVIVSNGLYFDEALKRGEDREFIKKLVECADKMEYMEDYPYVYRIHNANTMNTVIIGNEPLPDQPILDQWMRLVNAFNNAKKEYSFLSDNLYDHACTAYRYFAVNSIINCAGKTDICKNLSDLFTDDVFKKWFDWEFVFSQYKGKYRVVMILYKLRAYWFVEKIHEYRRGGQ